MRTTLQKVIGFAISYADWASVGFPRRSAAWVAELWAICSACPHLDKEQKTPFGLGACRVCGCHVSPDPEKTVNKLVWPTEGCPLDKPKWRATIEVDENETPNEEPEK